ncbi:MAG TPA: hypothetical protein VFI42_00450 [Thermomicrobiaceae bacterium]|nr:hypothetical protein [Thermomicrobiaceae bacterium]
MFETYIGANGGVYRLNGAKLEPLGLEGRHVSAVYAWRDNGNTVVLAGCYGDGIFRSEDGGQRWSEANQGLSAPVLRMIQSDPTQRGAIICGTEPARAFRSTDGGRSWQELNGVTDLEGYQEWYLPYSPRAGALRNFYSPPGQSDRLLGSIEVGGLIDSRDGGKTWSYVDVGPDHDIHWVTGDPHEADRLFAALGYARMPWQRDLPHMPRFGGVGRSRDGGATWEKLLTDYTRAVLLLPGRPNVVLAGPSPEVGRQGRIEVSVDGGDHWLPASDGITVPMEDMVERFYLAPDGHVWAVTSAGRVFAANPDDWQWQAPLPGGQPVEAESVSFVA